MQVGIKFSLAVHIMLCVAYFREEKVTGDFVAASSGINPAIARTLISQLKKRGFGAPAVVSTKAAGVGGITLARDARLITLLDIYEAVSEEDAMFRLHKGSPSACPVGGKIEAVLAPRFARIQNDFKKSLSGVSLADLLSDLG